jgi:hypothetical protein
MKLSNRMRVTLLSSALLCVMLASACKKDKNEPAKKLYGQWEETGLSNVGSRSLSITKDSIYLNIWISSGGVLSETVRISGAYQLKGDSLITSAKERVESKSNGQVISRKPVTGKMYEKATYKVEDNKLTINYTTYPADAPVATTANFRRLLPD